MANRIGEQIRLIRFKSGLSQEAFARKLGVSFTTINRWENGRTRPNQLAQKLLSGLWRKYGLADLEHANDCQNLKILLIEADQKLISSIQEIIKRHYPDFFWDTAEDSYEAGIKIASSIPDIIIFDFTLPGLLGKQICRKLKSDPDTCNIFIIALDICPEGESQATPMERYVDAMLVKPIEPTLLLEQIVKFCERKKQNG